MVSVCVAQGSGTYQLVEPNGPIPSIFVTSFSEQSRQLPGQYPTSPDEPLSAEQQFYAQSLYYRDQLLHSGTILFHDPFSKYLHLVSNRILASQPTLRGKIQIYVVRSPLVNAFTTHDGIIFVHMGLLAKVSTEAELAFILCHEISHYVEQHNLTLYLSTQSESTSNPTDPGNKPSGSQVNTHAYSKRIEEEADQKGLALFLDTDYDPAAAISAFDILTQAQQAFGTQTFHPKHWSTAFDFISVSPPQAESGSRPQFFGQEGIMLTHPDPLARQKKISSLLVSTTSSRTYSFLVRSQPEFEAIQQDARYECCHYLLTNRQYARAIYEAQSLMKSSPNDTFLLEIIRHGLYGLARYAEAGQFWDVHSDYEEAEGQLQQALFFFEQLSQDELLLMAILMHHPENSSSQHQARLNELLISWMRPIFYDWMRQTEGTILPKPPSSSLGTQLYQLLIDKIEGDTAWQTNLARLKRTLQSNQTSSPSPIEVGPSFEEVLVTLSPSPENFVLINPSFQLWNDKTNGQVRFQQSVAFEQEMIDLIEQYGRQLEGKYSLLLSRQLDITAIDTFNQIMLLQSWLTEYWQHGELHLVPLYHDAVQPLVDTYGTPYIVWLSGIRASQVRSAKPLVLVAGIIFPPMLPYSLFYTLTARESLFLYPIVVDLTHQQFLPATPRWINMKTGTDLFHAYMYDLMYQLDRATSQHHD